VDRRGEMKRIEQSWRVNSSASGFEANFKYRLGIHDAYVL
jgi:hypothetical protein